VVKQIPSCEPHAFPHTRWSVVLAATQKASPQCAAALEAICQAYWYPLYAYIRRCGHSPHDAQDLTQEFFARLLEKRWLEDADRERGKLRTFLIVAVNRFMANEWRKASAQKRGAGHAHIPIDTAFAENLYATDTASTLPPEGLFDQQWALTLINLTIQRLGEEFEAAGKAREFEVLKPCLMAEHGAISYRSIGEELGVSEAAAKMTIHRFRKRFREIYREEITQTLPDGADVENELRHLARALARE
jgi:RNA polymerase sigma-70 factor (ECF subfamily)